MDLPITLAVPDLESMALQAVCSLSQAQAMGDTRRRDQLEVRVESLQHQLAYFDARPGDEG
jgi:hypothetical protein